MPVVSDWFPVVVTAFNKSNLTDCIKKVDVLSVFYEEYYLFFLEMASSLTS